jgi:hypothetical protein
MQRKPKPVPAYRVRREQRQRMALLTRMERQLEATVAATSRLAHEGERILASALARQSALAEPFEMPPTPAGSR